jgi:hypothetical protein
VFDAERVVIDNEVAADDEKLDEGQPVTPAPTQEPKKKTPPEDTPENQKPVDAKLQSRLANQIYTFLKNCPILNLRKVALRHSWFRRSASRWLWHFAVRIVAG